MTSQTPPSDPGREPQPLTPADEKKWSVIVSLAGIVTNVVGPLITYLLLKDRGSSVRVYAANAVNFQLTLLIAYAVGFVLSIALVGLFVILAAAALNVVFSIVAAVRASRDETYEYPFSFRFVS